MELPQWLKGAARAGGPAQASAQPDWLPSQPASGQAIASSRPGWLNARAPVLPESPPPSQPQAPTFVDDTDIPDWLSDESAASGPISSAPPVPPAEDVPDWLRGAGSETPASPPPSSSELPDWLSSAGAAEPPQAAPRPSTSELPDWLGGAEAIQSSAAPLPAESESAPDWLSGLGDEKPAAPSPFDSAPDWLTGLDDDRPIASTPSDFEATPDWLTGLGDEKPAAPAPAAPEAVPDWLSGLGDEKPAAPASAAPEAVPDWLSGLGDEKPAAPASAAPEAVPDWLSGLGDEKPAAPASAAPEAVPDWLSGLGDEKPAATPSSAEDLLSGLGLPESPSAPPPPAPKSGLTGLLDAVEEPQRPAGSMTDLLSQLASAPANEPEPGASLLPPPEPPATPDWLRGAGLDTPAPPVATTAPPPAPEPEAAPDLDWLEGIDTPPEAAPSMAGLPQADDDITALLSLAGATESPAGDTPDWLQGLDMGLGAPTSTSPGAPAAPPSEAAGSQTESMPAWMRGIHDEPEAMPEVDTSQQLPAEMLSALDSLRFDALAAAPSTAGPEKVGALKDVTGVLKPELIFEGSGLNVAPFVDEWVITPAQQSRAARLADLLAEEKEQGVGFESQQYTLPALRIIASLVLLTAVLLSLLGGVQPVSALIVRPGLQSSLDLVDTLPADSRVLLVVETEPDSYDELAPLAGLMLADLAARDVELITISTRAQGPALAERLAREAEISATHLGYLPGRGNAISQLAAGGLGQPFAVDHLGQPTGLSGERLADLGLDMILIMAPRFEDLRPWVEQTQGQIDAPLVVIASTGSAPLALPYQTSGQVAALTWGLSDALAYDVQRHGIAQPGLLGQVGAQAVGSIVAAGLITLGAIFFGITALRRRRG